MIGTVTQSLEAGRTLAECHEALAGIAADVPGFSTLIDRPNPKGTLAETAGAARPASGTHVA